MARDLQGTRPLAVALLALTAGGCGAVHYEGRYEARHGGRAVEATAQVPALPPEGVVVVESDAAGFIVEGGLAAEARADATLPGFDASARGRVEASGSADPAIAGASIVQGLDAAPRFGDGWGASADWSAAGGVVAAGGSTEGAWSGAGGAVDASSAGWSSGTGSSGTGSSGAGSSGTGSSGGWSSGGSADSAWSGEAEPFAGSGAAGSTGAGGHGGPAVGAAGSGVGGSLALGETGAVGDVGASIELEAAAAVPRVGVHGLGGRPTSLGALVEGGLQVDGVGVSLGELEALADLSLAAPADARLSTDGAVEAFAELEHDSLPRSGGETHIVVRVRGPADTAATRSRLRVHLVIDRSSSMQRTWGRVIASARALIERLAPEDELHIVAYGTDVVEAWPSGPAGDGRAAIRALEAISVGGGTNIEGGLRMAYDAAARARTDARGLVLLLSDGVPNHGAFEPAELGALAASARARTACTTSVIGLGTDFDDRLLRAIAREGRGGYHVSADVESLGAQLARELAAHARVAARDLSIDVALGPGVELLDLGDAGAERIETAAGASVRLALPTLGAGEERRLVLRVRVEGSARARSVASVRLGYRSGSSGRAHRAERDLALSFGGAVPRTAGLAAAGLLDASLAAALDASSDAIRRGDARAAVDALNAHAAFAEGRVEHRSNVRLQARVRVVRRVAAAVGALLPEANHPLRRRVALAFGQLAVRVGR